jgi:hypothetical protein
MLYKDKMASFAKTWERFAVVAICFSFVPVARSQCPQPLAWGVYNCKVGSCQGSVGLQKCDTSNLTSPDQCVSYTPYCCGQEVPYYSSDYGSTCPTQCSLLPRTPSLPHSAVPTKQRSGRGHGNETREAKLSGPTMIQSEKEGR